MMETFPHGDLHVMLVSVGTRVRDERTGEEIEVTDGCAAQKGSVVFCTQAGYDELKRKYPENDR